MSLRDDLWTFCWGMIIGSALTALLVSTGCAEEPRWCKEPICETCPPAKTVVQKVKCINSDIEGCEARYAQLSNEYSDLVSTYMDERRCKFFQRCLKESADRCYMSKSFWCMEGPNMPPVCKED